MGCFAKVENGIVKDVIIADQSFINSGMAGEPLTWVETSPDGAFRGNYAGIGFVYDYQNDVFYPQKPFPSWTISGPTWQWTAPVPYPNDGNIYAWDEQTLSWILQ